MCKNIIFYLFAWIKYVFYMENIFENLLCLFMESENFWRYDILFCKFELINEIKCLTLVLMALVHGL